MKTAVIFYSRSGCTDRVARALAQKLGADLLQIRSHLYPTGWRGYFRALRHAMSGTPEPIATGVWNLGSYDLVFIGTPIWGSHVSAPVRSFLQDRGTEIPRAAFFATCGGSGARSVFRRMENYLGLEPVATVAITARDLAEPSLDRKLDAFIDESLHPRAAAINIRPAPVM